jgi:hypothetical protein
MAFHGRIMILVGLNPSGLPDISATTVQSGVAKK